MPFDDSLASGFLRGIFAVLRGVVEGLFEYVFAQVGKGIVYAVTFGRVWLDLDEWKEYWIACAVGFFACVLVVIGIASSGLF
jgi:hypothetical protein